MPHTELLPDPLPTEPLAVALEWLNEATRLGAQPNPNSMVLATVAPDGTPSARVVLAKAIVTHPGYVVFYTNYHSRKGRELEGNAAAAAVMHWDQLHRQVRIEGVVTRSPQKESDAYFALRPWPSRLGAWASAQSEPVESRAALRASLAAVARRFGVPVPAGGNEGQTPSPPIPRPPHWGGYRLHARAVELWVEGEARIHDRARWSRPLTIGDDGEPSVGPWSATRLQP
jgi:pyridoxamine 5'-phosphate oxidase